MEKNKKKTDSGCDLKNKKEIKKKLKQFFLTTAYGLVCGESFGLLRVCSSQQNGFSSQKEKKLEKNPS